MSDNPLMSMFNYLLKFILNDKNAQPFMILSFFYESGSMKPTFLLLLLNFKDTSTICLYDMYHEFLKDTNLLVNDIMLVNYQILNADLSKDAKN